MERGIFKIDIDKSINILPDVEIINVPPPPIALNQRKTYKNKWLFLAVFDFMILHFYIFK
jgi:hypothetical protein